MGRPVKGSVAACFESGGTVWRVTCPTIAAALKYILSEVGGAPFAVGSGVVSWDGRTAWVTVQDRPLTQVTTLRWLREVQP